MSRVFGSVRFRVTAVATVVVAVLLVGAALVMVRLVENDLIGEAEAVVNEAIGTIREDLGAVGLPENAFLEYEFDEGTVFVGLVQEDDEIVGSLIDPESGEWLGELIVDPDTGEVVEAFIEEGEFAGEPVPEELEELVASAVRLDGGELLIAGVPLEGVRDSIAAIRRNLFIIVPVLIALLAGVVWVLVGRALRPVASISSRARRITAETLHERVPEPGTDDEIGELATVVNGMLDRLEQGAVRQRQFVSDASHELRTPLASIRAAAELTQQTGDRERAAALAGDVVAEVDRIDGLVEDLLALARLDEGASDRRDVGSLREVVLDSVERLGDIEGVEVEVRPGPDVEVVGDQLSLGRMVHNLLANAARHAAGRVSVAVGRADGSARVEVEDDGPGIAADDRERVFDRFVRLDEARSDEGFGLGLAIVRSIAAAHGGTVEVEDSPLGGARFVVRLPLEAGNGQSAIGSRP